MTMKFGIFDHIEGIAGTSMHQLLRDRIELVKMADAAGFVGYHLAEHHGTDLCFAPNQERTTCSPTRCPGRDSDAAASRTIAAAYPRGPGYGTAPGVATTRA